MRTRNKRGGLLAVAACVALTLAGCGDSSIDEETEANEERAAEAGDCGELNMAVNPWVGYEADAYVVGHVAETQLGCEVNYKNLKEDVSLAGLRHRRRRRGDRGLGSPGPGEEVLRRAG